MSIECRERDLNPWTSAGQGPEPCAVDQAWLPLHKWIKLYYIFTLKFVVFAPYIYFKYFLEDCFFPQ